MRMLALLFLLLATSGWTRQTHAADPISSLPLPEMVVVYTNQPPVIDGRLERGEWDQATAATAFMKAFEMHLSRIQTVAWITYDDTYFYVALKNYRGPDYRLLKKRGREPDEEAIVFDTSNEIWITPPTTPAETYQTLFNSYPGVFDVKMIPSVGYNAKSWNGNWEIAASEVPDHWIIEARAPIKSFGKSAIEDGDSWRALFCTDALGGAGFTAWAPGGGFAEINRHGWLHFRDNAPVFQFLDIESIFTGKATLPMAVQGPKHGRCRVDVTVRFGANVETDSSDLVLRRQLNLADGQREEFELNADLRSLKLPVVKDAPHGYCEVKATADGGVVLYRQVFPFAIDNSRRKPPAEIVTNPYNQPIGVEGNYAPLSKKLIVKIDRLYFQQREQVASGRAELLSPETGKIVAQREIAPFYRDYSQFPLDLTHVTVPIETEEAWLKNKPTIEENEKINRENKQREKDGKPLLPLRPLPIDGAIYTLRVTLNDRTGQTLVQADTPVKLKGYQFEWLPNNVGISDAAIPPWTPIQWNDRDTIQMWNKKYQLDGLGLARQITNGGRRQLAGPMRLIAEVGGREVPLQSKPPMLTKIKESYAELMGFCEGPGIKMKVETRVEMDGCVLNTMQVTQDGDQPLDRLSLLVTMPKSEAECFVTTSGGWSSTFGWTPDRWDSRETCGGSFQGNFVPFVFLTDSERGFCWFADNEQGWILDPEQPTIELDANQETATLRVNFINTGSTANTTIRYGWMVTPQKPQPAGWRGWKIDFSRPFPETHAAFYGMAQTDWAVLWPYYASPYPWDYEKSKVAFDRARQSKLVLAAGNIAHAIARYRDYKGRWFNEIAADWAVVPGNLSNGNVALSRGPNDFRLWHWDRWIRQSGLNGLYFDETYLNPDHNYLTGGAYLLPDERVQPGYNFLGLRRMCMRLRYLFHQHGLDGPRLWFHTSANHPVYAWMPDIAMEAENVEPTGLDNDYMQCLPPSRLRSIGMGRNLGTVPLIMCQADRHWDDNYSPFCVPQMVGWVLAHDCLPENSPFWDVLAVESQIARDDVQFRPYWQPDGTIESATDDVVVSGHTRSGHALLWVVNTSRADRRAEVSVDLRRLGFRATDTKRPLRVIDAETGEPVSMVTDNEHRGTIRIDVPARFWRAVRVIQPSRLTADQTLVARFDSKQTAADDAIGYPSPFGRDQAAVVLVDGRSGQGVSLDKPHSLLARHHVTRQSGQIRFNALIDPSNSRGTLLQIDRFAIRLDKGKVKLTIDKDVLQEFELKASEEASWSAVDAKWRDKELTLQIDSQTWTVNLPDGMPLKQQARGMDIYRGRNRAKLGTITFGPLPEAILDDLEIKR